MKSALTPPLSKVFPELAAPVLAKIAAERLARRAAAVACSLLPPELLPYDPIYQPVPDLLVENVYPAVPVGVSGPVSSGPLGVMPPSGPVSSGPLGIIPPAPSTPLPKTEAASMMTLQTAAGGQVRPIPAVALPVTCEQFVRATFPQQRAWILSANPALAGAARAVVDELHVRTLVACNRTVTARQTKPSGQLGDLLGGLSGTSSTSGMGDLFAGLGTSTSTTSTGAAPDAWAQAAPSIIGTIGSVINGITSGLFGAEAQRLAAEGQLQAATLAAQQNAQTTALQQQQLQNAAKELDLRAKQLELQQNAQQAQSRPGGLPIWGWVVGGVVLAGLVGTAVVLGRRGGGGRRGGSRRRRR